MLNREQIQKSAQKHNESAIIGSVGEAENFARKKMAQFIIWYDKMKDSAISNGLTLRLKFTAEFEVVNEEQQ